MSESAGSFELEQWEKVADEAEEACMAAMGPGGQDEEMANGTAEAVPWLRQELDEKARDAVAWRDTT